MKKIALLSLAVALCASAFAAETTGTVALTPLASKTEEGITTVTTVGRAQAEIVLNADGSLTFQVYPNVTLLSPSGKKLADTRLDTNNVLSVVLPAEQVSAFFAEIKKAYDAAQAVKAAAATPPAP